MTERQHHDMGTCWCGELHAREHRLEARLREVEAELEGARKVISSHASDIRGLEAECRSVLQLDADTINGLRLRAEKSEAERDMERGKAQTTHEAWRAAEARVAELEGFLNELEAKPHRAEEIARRYREKEAL